LYGIAGMPRGVVDTTKSMIEALQHPLTQQPEAVTPYNANRLHDWGPQPESYPPGSMQDQLGANEPLIKDYDANQALIKALQGNK